MPVNSCIHFFNKININFIIGIFGSVVLNGTQDAITSISKLVTHSKKPYLSRHLIKQLRSLNHMNCPAQLHNQSIQSNRISFWHHIIYTLGIIHTSKILNITCQTWMMNPNPKQDCHQTDEIGIFQDAGKNALEISPLLILSVGGSILLIFSWILHYPPILETKILDLHIKIKNKK